MNELGTVLGVWAHPDDETYLSAGVMALAAGAGNRVVCVTATRGERGTDDPERWPPHRLAVVRDQEIAAAMAILGVADHRWLGYPDGALPDVDERDAITRLEALIREVEPDTILTFGPDGITGHPDHRAVSRWTTEAWRRTGGRARLLYATTTDDFVEEFADLHAEISVFLPGFPITTPADDVALALELDGTSLDRKLAALRAQATQTAPVIAVIGEERYRQWIRTETFRTAA